MNFTGFGSLCRMAFAVLGCCLSLTLSHAAHAVSIGELTLHSKLGEPLNASVPLKHLGKLAAHELIVSHAAEADYRKYGMHHPDFAGNIKVQLTEDSRGTPMVKITTERAVNEPFLDLVLQVRWPKGHTVKQFTLLLDPPRQ
jgi:pilus assembly protein FimV